MVTNGNKERKGRNVLDLGTKKRKATDVLVKELG